LKNSSYLHNRILLPILAVLLDSGMQESRPLPTPHRTNACRRE
jgi:hypothetical protein